ncbi:MAG: DUF1697 domain-containing protein [Chitinophagia bacterium]|nr:DUF1697 domain-containing protein [Chitinophagia bacterium]
MPRYVAFLRGINVAGQKKIKMDQLRGLFEVYGFEEVVTYIQSGNVIFNTAETDEATVRAEIEKMLSDSFQFDITTLVRSLEEIESVIEDNPYDDNEEDSGRKLYVNFLSEEPDETKLPLLQAALKPDEEMAIRGRDIYFLTPAYGETKLSNAFIEKELGVAGTARNWATVSRVAEL